MKSPFFKSKPLVLLAGLFITSLTLYAQKPVEYVNPFIGTSNFGATNPGAVAPRGMVSVSPFNVMGKQNKLEKDSRWLSNPYVHDNTFLTGFSHVNLSGVGCPDLGVILAMPTVGLLETDPLKYGSTYTKEQARAGYYSTTLTNSAIDVETTATTRVGISKYTFPAGQANILINLGVGLTNEQGAMIKVVAPNEIEGMRSVGSFCYYKPEESYPVYFVARVNIAGDETGVWKTPRKITGTEAQWMRYNGSPRIYKDYHKEVVGDSIGGFFSYNFDSETQVELKIGVSYVSIENARENLEKEAGKHTFLQVQYETELAWNALLSRVLVSGGLEDDKTMFYTALYHTLLHPNILNDVNGEYPKMRSRETGKTEGTRYTVFSLWNTYRNVHSLMSLIYPDQQLDMVKSMLTVYDETGWLPKWELNATETTSSVGDPAGIVIADTYLRGIKNFDVNKAYEAMIKSANKIENNPLRPGIKDYLSKGYLTTSAVGAVSTTEEYNVADFAISQLAGALYKKQDQSKYAARATSYRNLFDKETKLLRPKLANGSWLTPFNPLAGANFTENIGFNEGNAWQYTFMVSHDVEGLIKLMGGRRAYVDQLQRVFDENYFDMANEPNMGYPYLFTNIRGEEWRTEKLVKELRTKHYKNAPWGLPGNDDAGTMSAWLVYSMMGMYPVSPAEPKYALSAPAFDKIVISLDTDFYEGRVLVIEKEGVGMTDKIMYNETPYRSYFIDHATLVNGARLKFMLKE